MRLAEFFLALCVWLISITTLHAQSDSISARTKTCEQKDYKSVDTLFIAFQDLQISQPMWRKIMITPKQGNWYKVAYEDSHGGVARRAIHKHRIKKFTRHILQLKNSSVRCDSEGITRLTVQMAFCTDHFDIPICNGKKLEKMRHTLKIWK